MKHRVVCCAVFAALAASGSAWAQSSVTIYGRLNTSMENQKLGNGSSLWVQQDNASRWGLAGREDLGGGLAAAFHLESGFNADTGQTSSPSLFGRWSELSLSSAALGTLRLGLWTSEAYLATADFVSNHNHDTGTSADALYAGFQRAPNGIGYLSPEVIPGMTVSLATGLSEGNAAVRRTDDVAVNYTAGALALALGYNTFNSATAAAQGGTARQMALRAYYTVGPIGFGGYVQRDRDAYGPGHRTNLRLSAMYTLGASEFHLNGGFAGNTGSLSNSRARQYTLAYNYNLSKRTKAYTFVTRVEDGDAALYGGDFRSLAVGVRHAF